MINEDLKKLLARHSKGMADIPVEVFLSDSIPFEPYPDTSKNRLFICKYNQYAQGAMISHRSVSKMIDEYQIIKPV